jgi:hypothetical protein
MIAHHRLYSLREIILPSASRRKEAGVGHRRRRHSPASGQSNRRTNFHPGERMKIIRKFSVLEVFTLAGHLLFSFNLLGGWTQLPTASAAGGYWIEPGPTTEQGEPDEVDSLPRWSTSSSSGGGAASKEYSHNLRSSLGRQDEDDNEVRTSNFVDVVCLLH